MKNSKFLFMITLVVFGFYKNFFAMEVMEGCGHKDIGASSHGDRPIEINGVIQSMSKHILDAIKHPDNSFRETLVFQIVDGVLVYLFKIGNFDIELMGMLYGGDYVYYPRCIIYNPVRLCCGAIFLGLPKTI